MPPPLVGDAYYKGRKPTARAQSTRILELIAEGKTRQATADELKIGVASVYRAIKTAGGG